MTVFIAIRNKYTGAYNMFHSEDYQERAYYKFMNKTSIRDRENIKLDEIKYNFTMQKFNSVGIGQANKYSRFCVLIDKKNDYCVLSDDKESLQNYFHWNNLFVIF